MSKLVRQVDIVRDLQGQAQSLRGAELVLADKLSARIAQAEKAIIDAQLAAEAARASAAAAEVSAAAANAAAVGATAAANTANYNAGVALGAANTANATAGNAQNAANAANASAANAYASAAGANAAAGNAQATANKFQFYGNTGTAGYSHSGGNATLGSTAGTTPGSKVLIIGGCSLGVSSGGPISGVLSVWHNGGQQAAAGYHLEPGDIFSTVVAGWNFTTPGAYGTFELKWSANGGTVYTGEFTIVAATFA